MNMPKETIIRDKNKSHTLSKTISLRRLIALTFLGLFMLIQLPLIFAYYTASTNAVERRINDSLDQTVTTFQTIINDELKRLYLQADLLSKDFGFKQAVAIAGKETIQSALLNIQSRLEKDLAFVLDMEGDLLALANSEADFQLPSDLDRKYLIDFAKRKVNEPLFITSGDKLYEISVAIVQAPVSIGIIAIGKKLDDTQAAVIQSYSSKGLGVAFIHRQNADAEWLISGQAGNRSFVDDLISTRKEQIKTGGIRDINYNDETYSMRLIPLDQNAPGAAERYFLIYTSIDQEMSSYTLLFIAFFVLGVLGFGMMFIGGYLVSDKISAPIRTLAASAAGMDAGDYKKLTVKSSLQEVINLRESFNQMITAVKEREAQISFQAYHDVETSLPNGQYLTHTLKEKLAEDQKIALVIVEVRDFQNLKTVLEYAQINDLMRHVGLRLEKVTTTSVSRLTSDTFGLIIGNAELAQTIIATIVEAFMTPFTVADMKVDINLHIGFALAPDDAKTAEELTLSTHSAVDEARERGLDFTRYSEDRKSSYDQHLSLMSDLREDMNQGHVDFHYQPKLDLKTNEIQGAEALIRWHSPKHGFVAPDQFISMAERTGDIRMLTSWAIGKILEQMSNFKRDGVTPFMSINLSTRDLQNESLPEFLNMMATKFKIDPKTVCLEVTESAIMGDTVRALSILNSLSNMGFYLSIDDYGTGYSSLAYIKKLPVHELKIDKTFVLNLATNKEDQILVQSTIDLAHNLGMKVTAEGVEDAGSLDLLKSYGCDSAQGYYISRPVPATDYIKFWSEYHAKAS